MTGEGQLSCYRCDGQLLPLFLQGKRQRAVHTRCWMRIKRKCTVLEKDDVLTYWEQLQTSCSP
jgi:hypothetical protein